MSEHNLKELKRQLDNAKSLAHEAAQKRSLAEKRYHDARCRESGLMGKVATNNSGVQMIVTNCRFYGDTLGAVEGFRINKDGLPGYRTITFYIDNKESVQFSDAAPSSEAAVAISSHGTAAGEAALGNASVASPLSHSKSEV